MATIPPTACLRTCAASMALALGLSFAAMPATSAENRAFPDEIESKLEILSRAQKRFLRGGEVFRLVPTSEKLMLELAIREPEEVRQYVVDMMAAIRAMKFQPGDDLGEIPLNPDAEEFNRYKVLRPEVLNERQRKPGPFSVDRYLFPTTGIPTFAGARVALTPEDLRVGKVEVAITGIPIDMSSGRRNSRHGPQALRAMHGLGDLDIYSMLDPSAVLNIVDYGDFARDYMSVERSIAHVTDMVAQIAESGALPMLVGGDHSMMYPGVAGVTRVLGRAQLGVVHFGAHPDVKRQEPHNFSDVQAVYRLIKDDIVDGNDLVQVGLRGTYADLDTLQWMREQGIRYHTMAEVESRGWESVLSRVVDEVRAGPDRLYISFDVSVLDPGEGSAQGRAAPGGLLVREVTPLIRRLCAEKQIAGFEVMDLAPVLDLSYVSAMNANYVMNACLAGMAMRKQDMDPEYVSPIALDHGQD